MERKRTRKKFTLKKVKNILLKVWKNIVQFFKSLYERFMSLPAKVRYIVYVWFTVVVVIILIIILANSNNKHIDNYVAIEKSINEATLKYVEDNELYPLTENKLKLDYNVLVDNKYLSDKELKENNCEGFSVSYYDDAKEEYVINSYINCKKYTTKYYSDYKQEYDDTPFCLTSNKLNDIVMAKLFG